MSEIRRVLSVATFHLLLLLQSTANADLYEQFNAAFKVDGAYMRELAAAAYAKTKDPSFEPPKGSNVAWDPKPIHSLKALEVTFPEGALIMYSAEKRLFFAKGSEEWLEALRKLHEKNGIYFERTEKRP